MKNAPFFTLLFPLPSPFRPPFPAPQARIIKVSVLPRTLPIKMMNWWPKPRAPSAQPKAQLHGLLPEGPSALRLLPH